MNKKKKLRLPVTISHMTWHSIPGNLNLQILTELHFKAELHNSGA